MVINYPEDLADAANGVTDFVVFNDGTHDTWEQTEGEGAGLRKIKEIVGNDFIVIRGVSKKGKNYKIFIDKKMVESD